MNKAFKLFITVVILGVVLSVTFGIIKAIDGGYLTNASLINLVFIGAFIVLFYFFCVKLVKAIWMPVILLGMIVLQSCNYAKSNQQVLVSDDCGMNWKMIKAGDAVPRPGVNPCYMKVVIPNFPMQGDSKFITNMSERVRANVHIDYDYSITNPLAFIKQAKYLGKANSDADDASALDPSAFEVAENTVIDKRIREVAKALFLEEDIVELDQAQLENSLEEKSNKILEEFGVHLNFITLTFDLDEQTRQAIDVSTAMKIYESKGLTELGKQVMVSRAGASKITVETKEETGPKIEK